MYLRCFVNQETKNLIESIAIKNGYKVNTTDNYDYVCIANKTVNFWNFLRDHGYNKLENEVTLDRILEIINPPSYASIKVPQFKFKICGEAVNFNQIKEGTFFLKDGQVWKKEVFSSGIFEGGREDKVTGSHLDDKHYYSCAQSMHHATECYPLKLEIS